MQPVDYAPGAPAERHPLFRLPRALAVRSNQEFFVNLVRADRCHRSDLSVAKFVALLGHDALNELHRTLVIWSGTRSDLFNISFAATILQKEPPDCAVNRRTFARHWQPSSNFLPFVELCIEGSCATTLTVLAARDRVIAAQRLISDGATKLAVLTGQVKIKRHGPSAKVFATTKRGRSRV